ARDDARSPTFGPASRRPLSARRSGACLIDVGARTGTLARAAGVGGDALVRDAVLDALIARQGSTARPARRAGRAVARPGNGRESGDEPRARLHLTLRGAAPREANARSAAAPCARRARAKMSVASGEPTAATPWKNATS